MDRMPSSEFRRRYPSLKNDTLVTVNGHVIGEWQPRSYHPLDKLAEEDGTIEVDPWPARPIRPVPKPTRK